MSNNLIEQAQQFLKQENFPAAGKIFRQFWEEENNSYAASRYLSCLRKAGHPGAAIRQGKKAKEQFPDNNYIKSELIWACYDRDIKKFAAEENLYDLIKSAINILSLQPEKLPKELTVMAVVKLAKQKEEWQIVSEWCDKLEPQMMDNTTMNGKGKSKQEQWFFAKVKSLVQLELWKEARSWALEAIKLYPKEIHFYRWAALALGYQGKVKQAINELEKIISTKIVEWYIFQDLANFYSSLNQLEQAISCSCRAALGSGEYKAKVTLYMNIAQLSLDTGNIEMAVRNIELSKAIREQEGWKIKEDLQKVDFKIHQELEKSQKTIECESRNINYLVKLCQKDWKKQAYYNLPQESGIINYLPQDKSHGFVITDDGKRVFFLQRDLPPYLRKEKLRVYFNLEKTWDRKHQKQSFKAVNFSSS
ncbi:tetratricopeptide repeat protein [Dapis sp. BLCC M172]|uniref:tetratricopeptide repeat protein n=1 Tax=Dapis sp. BLCC M172 TaxID=2975281 RepID=UPI003CF5F497